MDLEVLGIMAPFFAFALLMLWYGTHHAKMANRQKLEELRLAADVSRSDDGRLAQQDARIEMLEDRVQVLERIITDKGYDLAHQIEALRDHGSLDAPARIKEPR